MGPAELPDLGRGNAMPPATPKTDPKFVKKLEKAAKREMTAEEISRQRISFVYGNLPTGSSMTRDQVAEVVARMDGKAA